MKFFVILFSCLSFLSSSSVVTADRVISIIFNNVTGPAQGLSCNANDHALMAPIFNISNYKGSRRQLRTNNDPVAVIHDARGLASSNSTVAVTHDDRGLASTQQACNDACRHAVGRFCGSLSACIGFTPRRALQSGDEFHPLYATCPLHVAEMNVRLNQLIERNTLSANCKVLIGTANRNATCEDGIRSGEVSGFYIEAVRRSIKFYHQCQPFPPTACYYDRAAVPFTTQVSTNEVTITTPYILYSNIFVNVIPCLTTLDYSIVGPNINHKETRTMLSGSVSTVKIFPLMGGNYGQLSKGRYNVTTVPNNNIRKAKSFMLIIA